MVKKVRPSSVVRSKKPEKKRIAVHNVVKVLVPNVKRSRTPNSADRNIQELCAARDERNEFRARASALQATNDDLRVQVRALKRKCTLLRRRVSETPEKSVTIVTPTNNNKGGRRQKRSTVPMLVNLRHHVVSLLDPKLLGLIRSLW